MKIKKTVIIAAVLAAVLSVTAVGCQGSADNSSAVATTSQNSAANVSDGNSESSNQTIDFTTTDIYKIIEPLKGKPAVKMTIKINYKHNEGDVSLETTTYYFDTEKVEASFDKNGNKTAVIYDSETQKIYAANLTKKKYFVLTDGETINKEDIQFDPSNIFVVSDKVNYTVDSDGVIIAESVQTSAESEYPRYQGKLKKDGDNSVSLEVYQLIAEDQEPIKELGEVLYFSEGNVNDKKQFSLDGLTEIATPENLSEAVLNGDGNIWEGDEVSKSDESSEDNEKTE